MQGGEKPRTNVAKHLPTPTGGVGSLKPSERVNACEPNERSNRLRPSVRANRSRRNHLRLDSNDLRLPGDRAETPTVSLHLCMGANLSATPPLSICVFGKPERQTYHSPPCTYDTIICAESKMFVKIKGFAKTACLHRWSHHLCMGPFQKPKVPSSVYGAKPNGHTPPRPCTYATTRPAFHAHAPCGSTYLPGGRSSEPPARVAFRCRSYPQPLPPFGSRLFGPRGTRLPIGFLIAPFPA